MAPEGSHDRVSQPLEQYPLIWLPLDALKRRADNPNVMEPAHFAALVSVIRRVGFLQPVLVRELERSEAELTHELIDGHHRHDAAREAGLTHLPAIVVPFGADLACALQIGMNRLRGELDILRCANSMHALQTEGWSLDELTLTGFDLDDCRSMLELATSAADPESALLAEPVGLPEKRGRGGKPVIELEFGSKDAMLETRKALRKVNPDLAAAVRYLLGLDD